MYLKRKFFNLPMGFENIHESVVKLIANASGYTTEDINKYLMSECSDSKGEFILYFNKLSDQPNEVASKTAENIMKIKSEIIKTVEAKNSCIIIYINKMYYLKSIAEEICEKKEDFGRNNDGEGKKVLIEFSSPNVAKIFHMGHFKNTILGEFLGKLFLFNGWEIVTENYLGDWGLQFGLTIAGFKDFGNEELLKADPLNHLLDIYIKTNKKLEVYETEAKRIFEDLENNPDSEHREIYQSFRNYSIIKYNETYKRYGIEFDVISGESNFVEAGKKIVKELDFVITEPDGTIIADCEEYGKLVLQKSNNVSLYSTRDIACFAHRMKKYDLVKMIYVVSSTQKAYFQQLFWIFKHMGYSSDKYMHMEYGNISGMSTRKGLIIKVDDVTNEVVEKIREHVQSKPNPKMISDKILFILALSFLIVEDFSAKRIKGYTFDIEKRLNKKKGEALGLNLQYTHCRLCSLKEKNSNVKIDDLSSIDFSVLENEPGFCNLFYKLLWFERVIRLSLKDYEPSRIVLYLSDLLGTVNSLLEVHRVKDAPDEIAKARLLAFNCTKIVIGNAIRVLGLTPINKM